MSISLTSGLWIVLGLLSITAVALMVLMIMMLTGRKGITHATVLSFVVSVLAHLGFVCAWFAWYIYTELHPGPNTAAAEELPPQDEAVQIKDVLTAAEDPFSAQEAGNADLEEFTEKTTASPLERFTPPAEELTEIDEPDRMTVETVVPPVKIPDASSNPELPPSIPKLKQAGATGPITASQIPLDVESPERQARPEVMIPDTPLERTPSPFVAQEDAPVERSQQTGSVNKIEIEPEKVKATPDLVEDPEATIAKTDLDGFSELAGPTPTIVEDPKLGTEADSDSPEGKTSDSPREKINRTKLADSIGVPGGALMRERPNFSPSVPTPTPDGLAVTPTVPDLDFPAIGSGAPNIVKPDIDMPLDRPGAGIPETYRLRSLENRADTARKYGGTEETERAVEKSLAWLAANQHKDGYWDADRYGSGLSSADDVKDFNLTSEQMQARRESGTHADAGVTALSLLAFLAAGYTNEEGQYAENVDRAIHWLIAKQGSDGYLGGDANHYAGVYCHAMATYALAEALGMQSDPNANRKLKQAVQGGVNYSLQMQLPEDGGWRYNKRSSGGDMSIFGWQLMALKSADIAGIRMSNEVKASLIGFLKQNGKGEHKGLGAYRPSEPPTVAMTAEALFCKQILGISRNNPQSAEAVQFLLTKPPKIAEWNLYYWYYGTLSMFQYGGAEWEQWNTAMRDALTSTQESRGSNAGSWDPVGPWGPYGGRVYSTALATLCLEVYYRFLPLYEHSGQFEE